MNRGDLSKSQWVQLKPLLPPEHSGCKGRPYVSHRKVLNGILWRLRCGAAWRDIPSRYGPWQTCYDRFVAWLANGLWLSVLQSLQAQADAQGRLDWSSASVDSSVIRAHQHAAGATAASSQALVAAVCPENEPKLAKLTPPALIQAVQSLGRSVGGFSTKIHLLCDGQGRPLAATLSPGQSHDSQHLAACIDKVRVPRKGRGRPKKRPR